MIINEEGTYTLIYTATDDCGKTTEVERELVVADNSPRRTVLYTDGTFIINEKQADEAHNIELHGAATNVYDPLDETHNYVFTTEAERPWNGTIRSILSVQVGSKIKPTSLAHWFGNARNVTSIDLSLVDTTNVTDMQGLFYFCRKLTELDLSTFDTSNVTNMNSMFTYTGLTELDLSTFDTSNVTDMVSMFDSCDLLTSLNVSSFDTSNVTNMAAIFKEVKASTLDLSGFHISNVTDVSNMFRDCTNLTELDLSTFDTQNINSSNNMFYNCSKLKTIYASPSLNFDNVQSSASMNMFYNTRVLVGGAGTTWSSSNPVDKTYARIDGGTSNPGYFTLKSA